MMLRAKQPVLARTVFRRVECEGLAVNCGPFVREAHCSHWGVYGIAASGVKERLRERIVLPGSVFFFDVFASFRVVIPCNKRKVPR